MTPHTGILFSMAFGLAMAAVTALGYELVTQRRASFRLLQQTRALPAAVPFLAMTAPFIILRNIVRGHRIEGRPLIALLLAGGIILGWSAASGLAATRILAAIL